MKNKQNYEVPCLIVLKTNETDIISTSVTDDTLPFFPTKEIGGVPSEGEM